MFDTELLRAVANLARVAGLPLILHNVHGGREQIMHVREGIRFEPYDGGYSQLKLVVAAVAALRAKPREVRPLRNQGTQRARTWLN